MHSRILSLPAVTLNSSCTRDLDKSSKRQKCSNNMATCRKGKVARSRVSSLSLTHPRRGNESYLNRPIPLVRIDCGKNKSNKPLYGRAWTSRSLSHEEVWWKENYRRRTRRQLILGHIYSSILDQYVNCQQLPNRTRRDQRRASDWSYKWLVSVN